MIIDFHVHIFPPSIIANRAHYLGRDPCFGVLYHDPKAKLASAEDLIASMDQTGVDISVILNLGWSSHELCVETNNYIIDAVRRYPDRLVGFCTVQPLSGDLAVAEVERCSQAGIKGIGELRPDTQGFNLGDEATMSPLAQAARRLGMIILTHSSEPVGHSYPGKGTITPDTLYPFICSFPDLTIVCAHWGGGLPFYALMPEVAASLGNVFFDTAASPFLYRSDVFRWVAEIVGAEKILFGTDYPLIAQARLIEAIRSLDLSQEVKEMILAGNARKLLKIASSRQRD